MQNSGEGLVCPGYRIGSLLVKDFIFSRTLVRTVDIGSRFAQLRCIAVILLKKEFISVYSAFSQ